MVQWCVKFKLVRRRHRTQTSGQQGLRHVLMSYIFCGDNSSGFLIIRSVVGLVGWQAILEPYIDFVRLYLLDNNILK